MQTDKPQCRTIGQCLVVSTYSALTAAGQLEVADLLQVAALLAQCSNGPCTNVQHVTRPVLGEHSSICTSWAAAGGM